MSIGWGGLWSFEYWEPKLLQFLESVFYSKTPTRIQWQPVQFLVLYCVIAVEWVYVKRGKLYYASDLEDLHLIFVPSLDFIILLQEVLTLSSDFSFLTLSTSGNQFKKKKVGGREGITEWWHAGRNLFQKEVGFRLVSWSAVWFGRRHVSLHPQRSSRWNVLS